MPVIPFKCSDWYDPPYFCYKLYDVGDGLALARFSKERMLIDCGSQQGVDIPFWKGLKQTDPRTFVLSHFHSDHYNGIYHPEADNSFCIQRFVFPALPKFINGGGADCGSRSGWQIAQELLMNLLIMNAYLLQKYKLGMHSGSMEIDIIDRVKSISCCSLSDIRKVSQGDWLESIHILWPPKQITRSLPSVCKALNAFHEVRERHPEINNLYERLAKQKEIIKHFLSDGEEETDTCYDDHHDDKMQDEESELYESHPFMEESHHLAGKSEIPKDIQEANSKLREVANRLSLAFFDIEGSMLFLGDLHSSEIRQVLSYLQRQPYFSGRISRRIRFLITAHHGTHESKSLRSLRVEYALSSVGPKLHDKLQRIYDEISYHHLNTRQHGSLLFF